MTSIAAHTEDDTSELLPQEATENGGGEEESSLLSSNNKDPKGAITSIHGPDTIPKRSIDKESKGITFQSASQAFAAVQLAHQDLQCRSKTAAFRILGLFPNQSRSKKHMERLQSKIPGYTVGTHSWFPILRENVANEEEARQKQIETVKRVKQYIDDSVEENKKITDEIGDDKAEERFNKSRKLWEKREKLEMDIQAIDDENEENGVDDDDDLYIPRTSEVRGQNWAAVSIISSPHIDEEPLINVLRAFETREDADDYVRNTCLSANVVTKCYSVRMYEWVHPCLTHTRDFFDSVKCSYSYSELEEIHNGKVEERKKIRSILESKGKSAQEIYTVIDGGSQPAEIEDGKVSAEEVAE